MQPYTFPNLTLPANEEAFALETGEYVVVSVQRIDSTTPGFVSFATQARRTCAEGVCQTVTDGGEELPIVAPRKPVSINAYALAEGEVVLEDILRDAKEDAVRRVRAYEAALRALATIPKVGTPAAPSPSPLAPNYYQS